MSNKSNNQILLVEGTNDQHVVYALCKLHEVKQNFTVFESKGKDSLLKELQAFVLNKNYRTIGIVLDADTDLQIRWQQVQKAFERVKVQIPFTLPTSGLLHTADEHLKVGVWLMPDNQNEGALEDFIRTLIPENDKLFPKVQEFVQQLEQNMLTSFKTQHKSKALMHIWLALQEEPGTPMGKSITRNFLNGKNTQAEAFVNWLKNLFH